MEEITNRIKRGLEAIGEEFQKLSDHEKLAFEKKIVFDYAKAHQLWIADLYTLGVPTQAGGYENTLAIDVNNNIVYKSNNLFNAGHSILVLLEQVKLHNALFPETRYELVGFTGIDKGPQHPPYVEVILKQDFVKDANQATPEEIQNHMLSLGFQKIGEAKYMNEDFIVQDLYPRNVLKDHNGTIYVVDDIVRVNALINSGNTKT